MDLPHRWLNKFDTAGRTLRPSSDKLKTEMAVRGEREKEVKGDKNFFLVFGKIIIFQRLTLMKHNI